MKNYIGIIMIFGLVACQPETATEKQAQLREYKEKIRDYNTKISKLESELDSMAPGEKSETSGIAVQVKEIKPETFTSYFETTGKVEAINDAYISPEINGQVSEILVRRGEQVQKGELLLRLKTDVTKNNIDEVQTSLDLAKKIFEKQQNLWEKEIGSEIEFLEARNRKESLEARLETLKAQLDMAYIHAPFSGIIEEINVKAGELASPGMRLFRLVNLDEIRITCDVSESYLSSVEEGEHVFLRFPSLPGLKLERPVSRVGSVIDPVTRTVKVEIVTDNRSDKIKPNMLCAVKIQNYADQDAMLVPSIILKEDFNGTFLFRLKDSDRGLVAEKVYVETGKTVQDITKVTRGIEVGDKVIVKGYNLVTDGASVRIVK